MANFCSCKAVFKAPEKKIKFCNDLMTPEKKSNSHRRIISLKMNQNLVSLNLKNITHHKTNSTIHYPKKLRHHTKVYEINTKRFRKISMISTRPHSIDLDKSKKFTDTSDDSLNVLRSQVESAKKLKDFDSKKCKFKLDFSNNKNESILKTHSGKKDRKKENISMKLGLVEKIMFSSIPSINLN